MPKVDTVKIVHEDSYCIINASDFDEETMDLFEGEDEPAKEPSGNNDPTKEQLEAEMKAASDEDFAEGLEKMDADHCKKVLDVLGVEYNKNLGVKKLREAVSEARAALTAAE